MRKEERKNQLELQNVFLTVAESQKVSLKVRICHPQQAAVRRRGDAQ